MQGKRPYPPLAEAIDLAGRHDLWLPLAWSDIKLRYRRTKLGPFWVVISTGITVLVVGIVYGRIFGGPADQGAAGYAAFFACGMVIWTFMAATITEACTTFVLAGGLIKSLRVPLALHVYRMVAKNAILLAHNMLIVVFLWLIYLWPLGWGTLLVIPGLIILVAALVGIAMTLAILCTRFRDLLPMVTALLQLMFLLTPIIWPPATLAGTRAGFVLLLNPAYYLIDVVRGPLLGQPPGFVIWMMAIGIASFAVAVGLFGYVRFRSRIPYWL